MTNKRVAIYIRVSTEEQAKEGFSINAQKEKLVKFAESQDWDIVGLYIDEGISAKDMNRPELQQMMVGIQNKEIDVVLVYKLDRLTRAVNDLHSLLEQFDKYNVGFRSATEVFDTTSAIGRLFITIVGAMAQWERENLGERVSMGKEQKARQGEYNNTNGVYGYDYVDGKLVPNAYEVAILNEMYDKYIQGWSVRRICADLLARNIPGKRNGRWGPSTVTSILKSPLYIGDITFGYHRKRTHMFRIGGNHEPIVTEEKFYEAAAIRNKRQKFMARKLSGDDVIFGEILYCKLCGRKVGPMQRHRTDNIVQVAYICNGRRDITCNAPSFTQHILERVFLEELETIVNTPIDYGRLENDLVTNNISTNVKNYGSELEKLKIKKKKLLDLLIDETITKDEYSAKIKEVNELEKYYKDEMDKNVPINPKIETIVKLKEMKKNIRTILDGWEQLPNSQKKMFIMKFIERIEVYNNKRKYELLIKL